MGDKRQDQPISEQALLLRQASEQQRAGRLEAAREIYHRVLAADPAQPEALHLLGVVTARLGDSAGALDLIERAVAGRPENPTFHFNLANTLKSLGQARPALAAYDRAIGLKPDFLKAVLARGNLLFELGELDLAEAAYRRALALAPDDPAALARLALLLERGHRLDEAEATLARAKLSPGGPALVSLAAARLARRRGETEAALAHLSGLVPDQLDRHLQAEVQFELGELEDRAGAPDRAFAAFTEANRLLAQGPRFQEAVVSDYLALIARLGALPPPPASGPEPAGRQPCFLIGFPRSGTTLLGQILDSHPGAVTLDERPTVQALVEAAGALPGGYPAGLERLTPGQIEALRQAYFGAVARELGDPGERLLVDKLPLATVHLGLIQRVFPGAPVVFVQRHPYDVCLSCFMQPLKAQDAPGAFVSLEGSATLYSAVIGLWQGLALPRPALELRYEALVEAFEPQVRRLLDYLGLPWDAAVRHFAAHAQAGRGGAATPSYSQVTRPLYRSSRYRWRRYQAQIGPLSDRLAPLVRALDYPTE